jgi:hypothetical protein
MKRISSRPTGLLARIYNHLITVRLGEGVAPELHRHALSIHFHSFEHLLISNLASTHVIQGMLYDTSPVTYLTWTNSTPKGCIYSAWLAGDVTVYQYDDPEVSM